MLEVRPTLDRSRIGACIEAELSELLASRVDSAQQYGDDFARLWRLAAQHLLGGKLVRPLLMVDAFRALTESTPGNADTDLRTVVRLAAAIELLHYAFLLHDDVIDGDLVRRGRPNLIGSLIEGRDQGERQAHPHKTLHWAQTGAILMGDLLLAQTHQVFARADLAHETRLRLLDLLDHTVTETTAGEHVDVGLSDGAVLPELSTILTMSAHKTATYTFELPLRAAAVLAGAPAAVEHTLRAVGRHLGLAYQLQDDLLSTFGDPAHHGKDPFSDLREGKETAIVAFARSTTAWLTIEPVFGDPALGNEEALRVRDLLAECGAERFVRGLVDEQLAVVHELIAGGAVPTPLRAVVTDFAGALEGRRS